MSGPQALCRLCAKPSPRLMGVDKQVSVTCKYCDLKYKMLLVNVDVSAPSPLPRSACFPCLCLLERTVTLLAQVNAAQEKLSLIYKENKDFLEECNNRKKHQDGKRAEIMSESWRDKLPVETGPVMCSPQAYCRLCAEPSLQLVGVDDEEGVNCDLKQKMLLVNVDVSVPSLLPSSICYSCLSLLKQTTTFLAQVSAAQDKLTQIYQYNNDLSEETDYIADDLDFGVKEDPLNEERVEIKMEPCHKELTVERGLESSEPHDIVAMSKKRGRRRKELKTSIVKKVNSENELLKKAKYENIKGKHKKEPKTINNKDETKQYKCDDCGKTFKFPCLLKRHAAQHTSAQPHICDQCGKTFSYKWNLATHTALHSDQSFVCSYCSKAFKSKQVFDIHVRMHTDVWPYSCEHCGKDYFDHASLYKHVQSVHGADPRKTKQMHVVANSNVVN